MSELPAGMPTAAELDASDPLAGLRARFAEPAGGLTAYLDGNSLGRPLAETPSRLREFIEGPWGERLIRRWDEAWMDEPFQLGDRLGEVVLGAAAGQTVVADSTSVLLYKLLRAGMDARPGRDELVVDEDNFPTDRYLAEAVAKECGARLRWLSAPHDGGVTPEQVSEMVGERTALVLLSQVAYRSGFIADAPAITALVHRAGGLVLWDLSHSVGSVPLALDDWNVDLAVGCTYKYLNGGPGSPAFAYVRRDLQAELRQPMPGWMGAAAPFDMTEPYRPADGMRRFLTGTPPILAMQPVWHMLEVIAEAGMPAVRAKSELLTARAVALFDGWLAPMGAVLASPRDPGVRGSHITVDHPAFEQVTAMVWERDVIPDFRPPDGIRIGLSPLSTSFAELDAGMAAVRGALAEVDRPS
ncbi:MAG: kynureninase [Actinomycetales bacterium]